MITLAIEETLADPEREKACSREGVVSGLLFSKASSEAGSKVII
jgi:hypothetical protein